MRSIDEAVQQAMKVQGRIHRIELEALAKYARMVPTNGLILEVGSLFGKSTIALALSTEALVVAVDNFSDTLDPKHPPSLVSLSANLTTAGCENVLIWRCDSAKAVKCWHWDIHTLFVDGCHEYEYARNDIFGFGKWTTDVIMVHDSHFPGVRKAIREFLQRPSGWKWVGKADSLAIMRRQ